MLLESNLGVYKFNGKEKDAESGYNYYGARYYDSEKLSWLSVDPMSDKYPNLSPYVYCANNPVKLIDPNGEDWYEIENKKSQKKEIKWTDYKSQAEMDDNGVKGSYIGNVFIDFHGYKDEKLGENDNMFGNGAKLAQVTVYGQNGENDIMQYQGFSMSSDYSTWGAIADGTYPFNYDEKGKSGSLKSHWAVNGRGKIPALDVKNPSPYASYSDAKDGIFIHAPNKGGEAGNYIDKHGKLQGISEGCLLIIPSKYNKKGKALNNGWDQFNKQLNGVKSGVLRVRRD